MDKILENLACRLKDLTTLRKLFEHLNYDFAYEPVVKDRWTDEEKNNVDEAKIIAKKGKYKIFYINTKTDSLREWKGISSKIIKDNDGLCLVCAHNPSGFKWVFSSLSKIFSKSFAETRHVPIDIQLDTGVPRTFINFLENIKATKNDSAIDISSKISKAFDLFAIQIHDELTFNVFEALKILSEGIINDKSNKLLLNDETLHFIREPSFVLLYRIIFILYAEDRGIFPINDKIYYEKFSLKWIKKNWLLHSTNIKKISEYDIQKRLTGLFRLIENGSEELGYNDFCMRSYYGRIFDEKINKNLEGWTIPNANFLKVLDYLTRSKDKNGNYFFLDYSALETRHLGSIYEHLLEFRLKINNNKISKLPDEKERKTSGSYYTPKHIVDYIAKNTLEPLIDSIIKKDFDVQIQIENILSLKILDPSMGSGHFLVGAVEYLAKRICEIEHNYVDEQSYIERKRDVVRRCIYGVDINPLAVDLARLSLWLETLSSEKPLSFLSAHLKCGNSLISSNIESIFDKQATLLESGKGRAAFVKDVKNFLMFENIDDDSPHAVKLKLEKYANMQSSGTIYYDLKSLLDCRTAKFFGVDMPNLGDYTTNIGQNSLDFFTDDKWHLIKKISDKMRFFHWEIEFPQIFYDRSGKIKKHAGFDAIIGNPPWQILKPDIDEFFSPLYDIHIGVGKFSKLNKNEKNKFVQKILNDVKINEMWKKYQDDYKKEMMYVSKSNNFKHQRSIVNGKNVAADINLYKLFVEKSYELLRSNGVCGLVIPSGIYSDLGSKGLRELILNNTKLYHIFGFINKNGIFTDVHRQFKFCTILFGKGGSTRKFFASFYMEDVAKLDNYEEIAYEYDVSLIHLSSPGSLSMIECKNNDEFKILKKMYRYPILSSDAWDGNFQAMREFDMANDSKLFRTRNTGYPLYEGKMINMFTHKFASPRYWVNSNEGNNILRKKEAKRIKKINKNIQIIPKLDSDEYRLVWRSITNSTNERTLISTILHPNVYLGNSLNYLNPIKFDGTRYIKPLSDEETFYLCGIFNSFSLDFILRHKVSTNINIFYLLDLPIPKYDKNNVLHKKIMEYTMMLICTTNEYEKIKKNILVLKPINNLEQRIIIQAKINALCAKIYGLTNTDVHIILENFTVNNSNLKKLKEITIEEYSKL